MLAKPKYLLFDHGGVLSGDVLYAAALVPEDGAVLAASSLTDRRYQIKKEDLVLEESIDVGTVTVIKDGVRFVRLLNDLVTHYGYQIVFHSANMADDQTRLLLQLQEACRKKGVEFPAITATVVCVQNQRTPDATSRLGAENLAAITWCDKKAWYVQSGEGKADLRRSLERLLDIAPDERSQHVVFDDGRSVVAAAAREGYKTHRIAEPQDGGVSLASAVESVSRLARSAGIYGDSERERAFDGLHAARSGFFGNQSRGKDDDPSAPLRGGPRRKRGCGCC